MSAAKSEYVKLAPPAPAKAPVNETPAETLRKKRRFRRSLQWIAAIILLAAAVAILQFFAIPRVGLVAPHVVDAKETLAVAGVVEGKIETAVGPEIPGKVAKLFVRENTHVKKGDLLAKISSNLAESQVVQAQAGLNTALAEERQVAAGTQNSEISAAMARVDQGLANLEQARTMADRAKSSEGQAKSMLAERQAAVRQAEASIRQARARQDLASKSLIRTQELFNQGAVPRARLDDAAAAQEVALSDVNYAEQVFSAASAGEQAAKSGVLAGAADVRASAHSVEAARSVVAQLRYAASTLARQPRPEARRVATARVAQARAALASARETLRNAEVRAPFSGIVTEILAEEGAVATSGLLKMVESTAMQVKLDVDEGNIPDLHIGQSAVISIPSVANREIQARVDRISSFVDPLRGTVEVTIVPTSPANWLRSGQTVDVNVILRPSVSRVTVPVSCVRKDGDKTVVFLVKNGRAAVREVTTGLVANGEVPLLTGISLSEKVIENPSNLEDGARVRSER